MLSTLSAVGLLALSTLTLASPINNPTELVQRQAGDWTILLYGSAGCGVNGSNVGTQVASGSGSVTCQTPDVEMLYVLSALVTGSGGALTPSFYTNGGVCESDDQITMVPFNGIDGCYDFTNANQGAAVESYSIAQAGA